MTLAIGDGGLGDAHTGNTRVFSLDKMSKKGVRGEMEDGDSSSRAGKEAVKSGVVGESLGGP